MSLTDDDGPFTIEFIIKNERISQNYHFINRKKFVDNKLPIMYTNPNINIFHTVYLGFMAIKC